MPPGDQLRWPASLSTELLVREHTVGTHDVAGQVVNGQHRPGGGGDLLVRQSGAFREAHEILPSLLHIHVQLCQLPGSDVGATTVGALRHRGLSGCLWQHQRGQHRCAAMLRWVDPQPPLRVAGEGGEGHAGDRDLQPRGQEPKHLRWVGRPSHRSTRDRDLSLNSLPGCGVRAAHLLARAEAHCVANFLRLCCDTDPREDQASLRRYLRRLATDGVQVVLHLALVRPHSPSNRRARQPRH
mmetsp:Transcript_75270/g.200979  ORF Transcript_75270/g.200979 Transcript_75270/m.200979 type:complete len:241 (+) Transcript_75270:5374-6096(+)